ncbi:MAG: hypothetical protein U0230_03730 [Polyangiales bacterium]
MTRHEEGDRRNRPALEADGGVEREPRRVLARPRSQISTDARFDDFDDSIQVERCDARLRQRVVFVGPTA